MELIGYQNKYFELLYDSLVNRNVQVIAFYGPKGSGKSVIVDSLGELLKVTWKVFKISGAGQESPPYYSWYSATSRFPSFKARISDISVGVNFQPFGLPIGLDLNVACEKSETIFNANELSIINAIRHELSGKEKILLLADDFELWDTSSKEFLAKLFVAESILGTDTDLHVVFISTSPCKLNLFNKLNESIQTIRIEDISCGDIEQIIAQQIGLETKINNLNRIIQFTGYDLRLITLAAQYQKHNPQSMEIQSLGHLLKMRISSMPDEQKAICKTLEQVSIINSFFSEREAAFLVEQPLIQTERILNEAVNLNFIRKQNEYDFPNKEIQKYFQDSLDIEKKYLHHKFAKYLQTYYPEDYFNRSYHLFLCGDTNGEPNHIEAAYLLAIEIIRRKEITNGSSELILQNHLEEILKEQPAPLNKLIRTNVFSYFDGFDCLLKCDYNNAIIHFSGIQRTYSSKPFLSEVTRLLLFCYVQLAYDLDSIKRLADELYDNISGSEFNEDELWCRAALLLLEVYGDRHIDDIKFRYLKDGFETRVLNHLYQSSFCALNAKYNMKSSLFFSSLIATRLTQESCDYYRACYSNLNLYYSLCNNAANLTICGEYNEAQKRLDECKKIISDYPSLKFPSTYKIDNNIVINEFLKCEGSLLDYNSRDKEKIISAARKASERLSKLRKQQGNEVSQVIAFNLYSMLMLSSEFAQAGKLLKQLEMEYRYFDNFYKYYYHNACYANNLLQCKYNDALHHLEKAEKLNVTLLTGYSMILKNRNQHLHQLISDQFKGDAFSFNYELIRRGMRVQDISSSFWGRGFLLSDLQFLSC